MIDLLIYDSGPRGQDICDCAGSVCADEIDEVRRICNRLGSGRRTGVSSSLRFSRMKSGRYLLSVIKYLPPNDRIRAHNRIVSLIMDQPYTDYLLNQDFVHMREILTELADMAAQEIYQILNSDTSLAGVFTRPQDLREPTRQLATALLAGASFSSSSKKFIIQFDDSGISQYDWLNWLMQTLPIPLRRTVSFHSDIQCAEDTSGVSLTFCSEEIDGELRSQAYSGIEISDICFYRNNEQQINGTLRETVQIAEELASRGDSDWERVRTVFPDNGDWSLLQYYLNLDWTNLREVFPKLGRLSGQQIENLFAQYPVVMQRKAWRAHKERIRKDPDVFRILSAKYDLPASPAATGERETPQEHTQSKMDGIQIPSVKATSGADEKPKVRRNYAPITKLALGLICLIAAVLISAGGISVVHNPEQIVSVYKIVEGGTDELLVSESQVIVSITDSVWRYCLRSFLTIVLCCFSGGLIRSACIRKK